jgi:hypothetical protein
MLTYPQLAHFPIVKRRRSRTVLNRAADGRTIKLADPAGEVTEWRLDYSELSDLEAGELQEFFLAAEGSLREFTFVDPTANLLAWSAKLDEAAWFRDPMLSVASGPNGTWSLRNDGGGPQSLRQTINGPAGFLYCFSLYARSETAEKARLLAGGEGCEQAVGADWRRLRTSGRPADPTFGLEIAAGAAIEVRGLQVDAQAGASAARVSTTGGVYEGARLRDDWIETIATGINRNSCTVNIVHAKHL